MFEGVAESRRTMVFHNTTDANASEPDPKQVAALLPGQPGPAKSLQVHAGDTVRLRVNARYETSPGQVKGLEGIATQIAGAATGGAAGLEGAATGTGVNPATAGSALANGQDQGVPQGYLNYILYDEDYQPIDQGFRKVSKAAEVGKANPNAPAENLSLEIPIAQEGYLYTYLSNEGGGTGGSSPAARAQMSGPSAGTANASPVYFDDFTVEQLSYIVQVDDYYPFGLTHQQPLNSPENKYLWSGKERQIDLGLNWDDFGARMYDPALGRFHTQDRFAEKYYSHNSYHYTLNNPINAIDVNGDSTILIGWNNWTSNFNSNFRNTVASRASNPSLLLNDASNAIGGMAQTVADATFLSNAMGRENQTANALEAGFNTLLDVPNMSREQIGALAAATTAVLMEAFAERKVPNKLGDLTPSEINQIQNVVEEAGRPLTVVGSAAEARRRGVGTNLPIGKGDGTRSDIDFLVSPSSLNYYDNLQNKLPSLDPKSGIILGLHNPFIGPGIIFSPGSTPVKVD